MGPEFASCDNCLYYIGFVFLLARELVCFGIAKT